MLGYKAFTFRVTVDILIRAEMEKECNRNIYLLWIPSQMSWFLSKAYEPAATNGTHLRSYLTCFSDIHYLMESPHFSSPVMGWVVYHPPPKNDV